MNCGCGECRFRSIFFNDFQDLQQNVLLDDMVFFPVGCFGESIDEKDFNTNYGTFFIWWDKIFKTYRSPHDHIVIGIVDNPYNKVNYFRGQWIGMKRFVQKLF